MGRFVITVEFIVHDGRMPEFLPMMVENANKSRTLEPGCDRFDVCVPEGKHDRVLLYEVYKDPAAFDAHLKAPHFLEFSARSKPLIKERTIGRLFIENDDGK
jgi:quinol monooxygenase YgiN